jgi:hypothetical protein
VEHAILQQLMFVYHVLVVFIYLMDYVFQHVLIIQIQFLMYVLIQQFQLNNKNMNGFMI